MYRGYTGHEHLPQFGLINMNGRLYDPVVGRMLSPDNHVIDGGMTQAYNRYAYALNNPLKFTDPDGEFAQTAVWAATFLGEFGSNLINGRADALGGAFRTANRVVSSLSSIQFPIYQSGNTTVSLGINPFVMGVGVSVSHQMGDVTASTSIGIGLTGAFVSGGVQYGGSIGGVPVNVGIGISATPTSVGYGANFDVDGIGGGYYQTRYNEENSGRGELKQRVGGISLKVKDFSFRIENDFLGDGGDRGRTNAIEIGYGNFVVGTNLYTNNGRRDGGGVDFTATDMRGRLNPENGAWIRGMVYSAPLWVGTRFGNSVDRVGYSHPRIQNETQNSVHIARWPSAVHAPFFTNYSRFHTGFYNYSGFFNPYSLYEQ